MHSLRKFQRVGSFLPILFRSNACAIYWTALVKANSADVSTCVVLTHGDLLESGAGQRHQGRALDLARKFWPRWLFRIIAKNNGLFLLMQGTKNR